MGYSVNFDFRDANNCKVSVQSLDKKPNQFVVIPERIADAFGLETTLLTSGLHESKQSFQMEKFNQIQEGEHLWFHFTRYYSSVYKMREPKPNTSYMDILRDINVAMNPETLPYLRIKFQYVYDELELSDGPPTVTVTLPPSVNSYFQFPAETVFHKGKRMPLPKFIIKQMLIDEIEREKPVDPFPDDLPCRVDVRCRKQHKSWEGGTKSHSLA